ARGEEGARHELRDGRRGEVEVVEDREDGEFVELVGQETREGSGVREAVLREGPEERAPPEAGEDLGELREEGGRGRPLLELGPEDEGAGPVPLAPRGDS